MNTNLKKSIYSVIKPSIPGIFLIFVLMLISTGFEALSPWPFKILLDNVLGHELIDTNTFFGSILARFTTMQAAGFFVVASYFGITLMSHIVEYIYSKVDNSVLALVTRRFAADVYKNLTNLDYGYFRRRDIGSYIYKLNYDIDAPAAIIDNTVLPILSSSLFLIVTLIILADIDLTMAFVSLASLPLLTLSLYVMNKKIETASQATERKNGTLYTYVEQVISQLKIVQAYTKQNQTLKKYDRTMWSSIVSQQNLYMQTVVLTLINGLIIGVTYSITISIGIGRVASGALSSGLLIVFILYMDNIVSPVINIIDAISDYRKNYAKLANTAEIFDPANQFKDTGKITEFPSDEIAFDDINIEDEGGNTLMSHVTFTARPGELTAIIGKSGSGKSSLFMLLLRLSAASHGSIKIGDNPIEDYTVSALRNHIAYVPQETELFNEKIVDVIRFGSENATQVEIYSAARKAHAAPFIEHHEIGYESRVGEGGNLLSGGERQRLVLARAFLRNSPILLLDEVFSAQDTATQTAMMKSIRELLPRTTILMITHTYTVLQPNDHVILIDRGKIAADSSFASLEKMHKLPSQNDVD